MSSGFLCNQKDFLGTILGTTHLDLWSPQEQCASKKLYIAWIYSASENQSKPHSGNSDSEGHRFDSCRVHQISKSVLCSRLALHRTVFYQNFTRQSADPFPTRHFYFSTTSGRQNLHAAEADFSWQYRATYR